MHEAQLGKTNGMNKVTYGSDTGFIGMLYIWYDNQKC